MLCDRFNDSTVVYQGNARGLTMPYVENLCSFVCGPTVPDLTFFLDVDPKIGLARTKSTAKENAGSGEVDRIESEKIEFHTAVSDGFKLMAEKYPERIKVLDAGQTPDEVFQQAVNYIQEKFPVLE